MATLSPSFIFRRADGTFREMYYDSEAGTVAAYDAVTNGYQMPRPRNVDRPYRNDDDEPADCIYFLRRLRQSIYSHGPDRTHCSTCDQPICRRRRESPAGNSPTRPDKKPYHWLMMSPPRVLRDIVINNAVQPLKQIVAETLLDVFGRGLPAASVLLPPTVFPYFSALPFEIRRMIWDLAMPSRVLGHSDLTQTCHYGGEGRFWPGLHSDQEPWRPDLFYSCVEARHVVEYYARRGQVPQKTGISSEARLVATLDVVYLPWLGSKVAGAGKSTRHSSIQASAPILREEEAEDGETDTAPGVSPVVKSVPYGQWTYQLRALFLPLPTVALDVGWIDKQHADTLAWIAGVDLEDEDEDEDEDGTASATASATEAAAWTALRSSSYLSHLQVVVADILVPVAIRLDRCTAAQRQLLLQSHDGDIPDLAGKDFTVLVDLYDDWRIDEVLSLQMPLLPTTGEPSLCCHGSRQTGWQRGLAGRIVNKAARHRCIECTRAAWETRDWSRFGLHLGRRLQSLCRPMIVFSVILELSDGGSEGRT